MKPQEKRILAPVDFSADSLHTIRYLAEHHSTGTRLTVLHVVPDEVQGDPDAMLREHLLIFSRYSGYPLRIPGAMCALQLPTASPPR